MLINNIRAGNESVIKTHDAIMSMTICKRAFFVMNHLVMLFTITKYNGISLLLLCKVAILLKTIILGHCCSPSFFASYVYNDTFKVLLIMSPQIIVCTFIMAAICASLTSFKGKLKQKQQIVNALKDVISNLLESISRKILP